MDLHLLCDQKPTSAQHSGLLTELLGRLGIRIIPKNLEPRFPVPYRLSVLPLASVSASFCFLPQCGIQVPATYLQLLCQAPQHDFIGINCYFPSFRNFQAYPCTNYNVNVWQHMLHLNTVSVKTEQISSLVTIPLKIKCQSACLGLLIDNAISITVQLCKLLIKHRDRGKNRRCQMNPRKRHEVQAVKTAHAEVLQERWKLLW